MHLLFPPRFALFPFPLASVFGVLDGRRVDFRTDTLAEGEFSEMSAMFCLNYNSKKAKK